MKKKTSTYSIANGGEIDGLKIGPLSPPVFAILKRRGNVLLVTDSKRDQDEACALAEVLFVCTLDHTQRGQHFATPLNEWDDLVLEFMAGLEDATLEKFSDAVGESAKNRTRN